MTEDASKRKLSSESLNKEENAIMLYEMLSDSDDVLYVGVGPLKSMLEEHMPGGVFPMPEAAYYRKFTAGENLDLDRQRSILLEDMEEICGSKPKYNN